MRACKVMPILLVLIWAVAGCAVAPAPVTGSGGASAPPVPAVAGPRPTARAAVDNFASVVRRVEPVAEAECRRRSARANCDFLIQVDTRTDQPINAFQTLTPNGQPLIVFTVALIADARNQDELAFVLGHEAAHHIAGHLDRVRQEAALGAMAGGLLASVLTSGASDAVRQSMIEQAMDAGAFVGARRFSKENELEADALGTVITARAGYDPIRGAGFFSRLPDPGDQFLGSHPPNAERIEVVRQVASGL